MNIAMTIIEKVKKRIILKPSNIILVLMIMFAACDDVRLHTFHELKGEWLATDTLQYKYYNFSNDAAHELFVQLRCSASYPVRELWLCVESLSGGNRSVDTLCCEIYDSLGRQQGASVGLLHQTSYTLGTYNLQPHDTAFIKVTHLMDAPVYGVTDVGIKVCGSGRHRFSGN